MKLGLLISFNMALINKIEKKYWSSHNTVTLLEKSNYDIKITEIKNKMPNNTNLVNKIDYVRKITDIEKKNWYKWFS